jgi:hypothetical protein
LGGGGGGGGAPGGGGGGDTGLGSNSAPQQQNFEPEEFTQDTSISTPDGAFSEEFTFQNEGGSSADELLTDFINDNVRSGRLTRGRT